MSERGFNRFFEFLAMLAQSVAQFRHMNAKILKILAHTEFEQK